MIVDFHAHIYPYKIADNATKAIGDFYNAPMFYNGHPEQLIESGSKIGVTHYVVHSVATKPMQVESINNFILSEMEEHPEFIGFGTIHPDYDKFEDEMNRMVTTGLHGIKIHPDFQKFHVDSPRMDAIYELATELKLPVLVHAGDIRYDFSGPSRIKNVLQKHPHLTLIAAHFGGYTQWDDAIDYLVGENVYFDTSSSRWKLPVDKANHMIKTHGVDKFLFGSDFPMWDHEDEFERFNKLDLSGENREMVLYKNAERLLGMKLEEPTPKD